MASRPAVIRTEPPARPPIARIRGLIAVMALLLYGLDQWTKHVAETNLTIGEPIPVIDGLLWWSLYNPGAAFSMGTHLTVVLSVLSPAVLIAVVTVVIPRVRNWLLAIPVSWLLAGVAGNLTDRLFREPGPSSGRRRLHRRAQLRDLQRRRHVHHRCGDPVHHLVAAAGPRSMTLLPVPDGLAGERVDVAAARMTGLTGRASPT